MFLRMLKGALFRQRGRHLMIALTVALGASVATSMLSVMFDVGDKINQELKNYGANIVVRPKGAAVVQDLYQFDTPVEQEAFLQEDELGNIKTIFWTYNIVDFSPLLSVPVTTTGQSSTDDSIELTGTWFSHDLKLPTGDTVTTGLTNLRGWWTMDGAWPQDGDDNSVIVGSKLAQTQGWSVGHTIPLSARGHSQDVTISGIFTSDGDEDSQIYAPLHLAQTFLDKPGAVGSVEVSALTTPDNDLARKAAKNPASLSLTERETWYCTAYVSSIAYQIEEAMTDAVARPVRQVSESEGIIMEKTQMLMLLVTVLSLAGSALAIANLVTANVMERAPEIGLLKAVGAKDNAVVRMLLAEITIVGLVGGVAGYFAGIGFAQIIGRTVFSSSIAVAPVVAGIVAVLVTIVVLAGSIPAIRFLLGLRPAEVLHGR